jgi:hypothetical protein
VFSVPSANTSCREGVLGQPLLVVEIQEQIGIQQPEVTILEPRLFKYLGGFVPPRCFEVHTSMDTPSLKQRLDDVVSKLRLESQRFQRNLG